jgi:hypothetical protein
MMSRRAFLRFAVCVALFCAAGVAAAQPRDSAAAEALFRAARQAAEAGDWQTACQRFEESNRLDPAVGTVFNLAHCREQLGQVASAWQRYLEVVQKLSPSDERVPLARERAQAMEKRVPRLVLELRGAPEGTVTLKDGVEIGRASFGVPLPVNPGAQVVEVRAPGHEVRRFEVTLSEGETQTLELTPGERLPEGTTTAGAPVTDAPQDRGPTPQGSSTARTVGFVVGGIGLLALAGSLTAGALALSEKDTVEQHCVDKRCTDEGLEAGDKGRLLTTVANVAFVAGAAGLGVGAYLVLTSSGAKSETALPAGAVLGLKGRF